MTAPRLYNLVAELTYRCPLRCVYCSNPIDYRDTRELLDGAAWSRVFTDAAALGALHVGLTGGEPTLHPDLVEIVSAAARASLYTHLITAGTTLDPDALARLRDIGLRSVQLSVQDAESAGSERIAGVDVFEQKLDFARSVRKLGLPLCINAVVHRENLDRVPDLIELAARLDAQRLELANTQYYGWALANRAALLPSQEQLDRASRAVERARRDRRVPEIVYVLPDYHAGRPKPCMGGWGRKICVVAPDGRVLPCHAANELPDLEFWSTEQRPLADCWRDAPGMNAFRGDAWLPEPCRSCPESGRDFGGCRCQAFALTGDPSVTDPACDLSPHHQIVVEARNAAETPLRYRGT
ncbi:MAG: pyrroloquinoline quinone biosynthesis protein PqqE [Myxococcota bacterium]